MSAVRRLMQIADPPTAIVCSMMASPLPASRIAAASCGCQTTSVIGYNNELISTLFHPELTTIRQPLEEIASSSIEMLRSILDQEKLDHSQLASMRRLSVLSLLSEIPVRHADPGSENPR